MGKDAGVFSTSKNYAAGDLALYNGVLYEFIAAHTAGAWNAQHVRAYDDLMSEEVNRVIAGTDIAQQAVTYAGTIVFEPAQVAGTRYKYTLTN